MGARVRHGKVLEIDRSYLAAADYAIHHLMVDRKVLTLRGTEAWFMVPRVALKQDQLIHWQGRYAIYDNGEFRETVVSTTDSLHISVNGLAIQVFFIDDLSEHEQLHHS